MLLKEWREKNEMSLARLAAELGVPGEYPAGTVQRWEVGKSRPEADIIDRIEKLTDGSVTSADMHEVRLAWLNKQGEAA